MKSVNVIGRTTNDIDVTYREGKNGKFATAIFTVAVNTGKDKKPEYYNFTATGKTAESLSKYVGKGSLIGVGGELTNWTDKEGHTRIGLIARTTEYLALKRREVEEPSLDFEY